MDAPHGLPVMQRYAAADLPAPPEYHAVAADRSGMVYVATGKGLMRLRGGSWELFELPRRAIVHSVFTASDGRTYVGGQDCFGILHTEADGSLRFEDLRRKFGLRGKGANVGMVWTINETSRGMYFRTDAGIFFYGNDGTARHWPLPSGALQRLFLANDALYIRIGSGLHRADLSGLPLLPGSEALGDLYVLDVQPRGKDLLVVTDGGFYADDAGGLHKLAGIAGEMFAAHTPYASLRLADGSLVVGAQDGVLMRFSPNLDLIGSNDLGTGAIYALGVDPEGGLWATTETELLRLRLPSPWTVYNERHGLRNILYDSAWFDGALWVATGWDVLRAASGSVPGAEPHFEPMHWTDDFEAFALEATDEGLLIGDRLGIQVLDPGARVPRRLIERSFDGTDVRFVHAPGASHALALIGNRGVYWLVQRGRRWQALPQKQPAPSASSVVETGEGEYWFGDTRGGAQRWRYDPGTGALRERRNFGSRDGLAIDPDYGTRVMLLDGRLYAISGQRVQMLRGERFIDASLPQLPGLVQPWELESTRTALGTYLWTSKRLWHRPPRGTGFVPLHVDMRASPGYRAVRVQADGKLRIVSSSGLLQFDPDVPNPESRPLHARLLHAEQRAAGHPAIPLALAPAAAPELPPDSGFGFLFGVDSVEANPEYRYRMRGYNDAWSEWSADPVLSFRRLPPGDFTLELEARTIDGRAIAPLRYPLRVAAYWYQTLPARVLSVIAGLLVVAGFAWLVARVRYRQVLARNVELEQKVSERTNELAQANRKLVEIANRDGLTGVANRRALENALEREWARCGELGQPLAVVIGDVDYFKRLNDEHGHLAGDAQLQRIARAFADEAVAPVELAARYGGEEFVLLLPGLSSADAVARAERLRRNVEQATRDGGLPATISLGVATEVPAPDSRPAHLLKRADEALYRAKDGGRNRVEAAPASPATATAG